MPNIMRWIGVLPGAVVCAFLSAFPLHLVLYQTLTGSGIVEPYPELPERLLGPLVAALAFVWAGSRIAPNHKVETGVALFGAWLLLAAAMIALAATGARIAGFQMNLRFGALAPAGGIVGAAIGLYLVYRQDSSNVNLAASA